MGKAAGFAILAVTLVSIALAERLDLPALTDRLFQIKKAKTETAKAETNKKSPGN